MSQRIAAVLLAVATIVAAFNLPHAGAQTSQGDEINRRAKSKVPPIYPELARKMSLTGTVKIEVLVSVSGKVVFAHVVDGRSDLNPAALAAAKRWTFAPAKFEGHPVQVSGVITFNMRPKSGQPSPPSPPQ